jgi:hypothetical protein
MLNWPVEKGIKFIIDSACPNHQAELRVLIGDIHTASRDDMMTLFHMFINLCQDEPDLIDRGGSLMDRIRLSLIKSYPDNLTEEQIKCNLSKKVSGITGKLQKNTPRWFGVVDS